MRAIVRSTSMVASALGVDNAEWLREVLEDLGHVPQIVDGAPMWVLDDGEMAEVAEAVGERGDDDDGDDDGGDDDDA